MLNNSLTSQVITSFYGLDVRQPDLADCFRGRWNVATFIRSGAAAKVLTFFGSLKSNRRPRCGEVRPRPAASRQSKE
jgi:hypothetical protein